MIKSFGQKAQEPKTLVFTSKCFFPSLFWQLNSSFSFYRASACWAPIKHERNDVWLETESVFCSLVFCCVALHRVEIIESTWWASFASRKNKWLAICNRRAEALTGEQLNEINAASERRQQARCWWSAWEMFHDAIRDRCRLCNEIVIIFDFDKWFERLRMPDKMPASSLSECLF